MLVEVLLAQLVEHVTFNDVADGSNPSQDTIYKLKLAPSSSGQDPWFSSMLQEFNSPWGHQLFSFLPTFLITISNYNLSVVAKANFLLVLEKFLRDFLWFLSLHLRVFHSHLRELLLFAPLHFEES